MLIRDCVHSGLCPFGIVSIRDCVLSGWCPFGIVSIGDGVHWGWCPFGMVSIRDGVHSGLCPFGIVSIRDCVHSGLCPFGMVSIRDCVHSGLCPFGIVSIRDCVHSGLCPFGIVFFGIVYRIPRRGNVTQLSFAASTEDMCESNGFYYAVGWAVYKELNVVNCDNCTSFFTSAKADNRFQKFSSLTEFKSYKREIGDAVSTNFLCHPSKSVFDFEDVK